MKANISIHKITSSFLRTIKTGTSNLRPVRFVVTHTHTYFYEHNSDVSKYRYGL